MPLRIYLSHAMQRGRKFIRVRHVIHVTVTFLAGIAS